MAISPVVTRGYGSFGSASLVVTRGYVAGVILGYDLTGFASALAAVQQMVADQAARRVTFAGGSETWIPNPAGTFTAIVAVGGGLVPTTTNAVRATLTSLRAVFDLVTAASGTIAAQAVTSTSAAVPAPALESGTKGAIGPVVFVGSAQGTSYDLSGIASLQTTAAKMLVDQQSGVTNFERSFLATLSSGSSAKLVTMATVRALYGQLRAAFDQLAQ